MNSTAPDLIIIKVASRRAPYDWSAVRRFALWISLMAVAGVLALLGGAFYAAYLLLIGAMFLASLLFVGVASAIPEYRGVLKVRTSLDGLLIPGRRGRELVLILPVVWPFLGIMLLVDHLRSGISIFGPFALNGWLIPEILYPVMGFLYLILMGKNLKGWRASASLRLDVDGVAGTFGNRRQFWEWAKLPEPIWADDGWKQVAVFQDGFPFPWLDLRSDPLVVVELIDFYRRHPERRSELTDRGVIDRIQTGEFRDSGSPNLDHPT